MPAVTKCPACGHRLLQTSVIRICSNCGAFLPEGETINKPANQEIQHQHPLPSARSQVADPLSITEPQISQNRNIHTDSVPDDQQAVVPYAQDDRQLASLHQLPTPYDQKDTMLEPLPAQQMTPVPAQGWVDPKKLPRGFPRRPADISGTLVHVQSQMEKPANDILSALFKGVCDIIWSNTNTLHEHHKDKDLEMVTSLRVRQADGGYRDARIRGYLVSANLTIGDFIALWGTQRQGTLHVSRGYNYTSKSKISTRGSNNAFATLLVLAILVAIIYLTLMNGGFHISSLPF